MNINGKILIVDDNKTNLQVLSQCFNNTGHKITLALNGKEALEIIQNDNFDLIILDIMMPGINGFEVCSIIRNELNLSVPVLFLSAKTDKSDVLAGFEYGAQDYLTKPFDSRELLARVNTQIELFKTRKKLSKMNTLLEAKVKERTKSLNYTNKKLFMANEKLQVLEDAKIEFLRIIAHEIRTPLNGIKGFSDLINQINESEKLSSYINRLIESVQRLEDFSTLALQITSFKLQEYQIKNDIIDLREIIKNAILKWQNIIAEKHIEIKFDGFKNPILIIGENELIYNALCIIIENAVKHTVNNSNIKIVYLESNNKHNVSICDQGAGFDQKLLINQFSLFSTADKHYNLNMGLNLPLANYIILAHNGKTVLENQTNGGGIVKIILPVASI